MDGGLGKDYCPTLESARSIGESPRGKIDTEKLDFTIITTLTAKTNAMAPNNTNKKYNELTEKQKRAVLGALLGARVGGDLPHGTMAKIA